MDADGPRHRPSVFIRVHLRITIFSPCRKPQKPLEPATFFVLYTGYLDKSIWLCTGQKIGNGRETRLFPKRADLPTAKKKPGFFTLNYFLSCTQSIW